MKNVLDVWFSHKKGGNHKKTFIENYKADTFGGLNPQPVPMDWLYNSVRYDYTLIQMSCFATMILVPRADMSHLAVVYW